MVGRDRGEGSAETEVLLRPRKKLPAVRSSRALVAFLFVNFPQGDAARHGEGVQRHIEALAILVGEGRANCRFAVIRRRGKCTICPFKYAKQLWQKANC